MGEYNVVTSDFFTARLGGTGRAMGKNLGAWLQKSRPGIAAFHADQPFAPEESGFSGWEELKALGERACPGIGEEIEGFAEAVDAVPERTAFWAFTALKGAHCSHAAVAPHASAAGAALVMRSYEWNPDQDDLLLCITKKKGAYAHLGCSCLLFGRMEGLNEKGLSVTMSGGMAAGLPNEWRYKKGLNVWVVIRGMLERCADAPEALRHLRENIPTGNHCLILADREGRAVLAEMGGGDLAVREMGDDPFIASVNHFTLPPLAARNKHEFILSGSIPRLAFINDTLRGALPKIGPDALKRLLAGEAPHGCFGPWYSDGFGTLWASLYDLGAGRAEYCFGAPGFGTWRTFGFEGNEGLERYEAVFPKKETAKPA